LKLEISSFNKTQNIEETRKLNTLWLRVK